MDPRIVTLAKNLVNYSCKVKEGERVLIQYTGDDTKHLVKELIKEVYAVGGVPFVHFTDNRILRELLLECTEEQLKLQAKIEGSRMKEMDCFIGIRGGMNSAELGDVPSDKMELYMKHLVTEVHGKIRVPETRWVVLRYPNNSMAQMANMSLDAFEEFYFNVCNLDYNKMSVAMDSLVAMMEKTDRVRITGQGTDLEFSIKGIPVVKCDGELNIPDGEVFTAPVRDSINGTLTYTAPALYQGTTYENICFKFENGKIVEATANETEKINAVLDSDEGARYIGEFAIGVNPYILDPMRDTLFDEKIMGSFHMTPGRAYNEAYNGNDSSIHWDLVCIQTPAYGGGEMYFDDVLVRKDGMFVVPELECLNPENLK